MQAAWPVGWRGGKELQTHCNICTIKSSGPRHALPLPTEMLATSLLYYLVFFFFCTFRTVNGTITWHIGQDPATMPPTLAICQSQQFYNNWSIVVCYAHVCTNTLAGGGSTQIPCQVTYAACGHLF